MKMKIGFLLLRNLHHIYHIAPIAYELSRRNDVEIIIFTSFPRSIKFLSKLNSMFPDHNCNIKILQQSLIRKIISTNFKRRPFPRAKNVIRNNMDLLLSLDAIVSPDFYTDFLIQRLKRYRNIKKPKFIFTFHGAGDRAFGFRDELKIYDFLLLSGEKVKNRLQDKNILTDKNWKIIGYPKFDIANNTKGKLNHLFKNQNTAILYNPHFQKNLSSWPLWGLKILEKFYNNNNYNLIFSPHIALFEKKQLFKEIPQKYFEANNIYIDTGSDRCADMTYTNTADIYMGDASSQAYEFIYKPRPCIFLNTHNAEWKNNKNYQHWNLGKVINHFDQLIPAIESASEDFPAFQDIQKKQFKETFDMQNDVTSSKRGADAILEYLKENEERVENTTHADDKTDSASHPPSANKKVFDIITNQYSK